MQKAVEMLDGFIHEKANHSTMAICNAMMMIADTSEIFTSSAAQQEFAQKCSNFEKHSVQIGKRSWGRVEFEKWWNNGYQGTMPDFLTASEMQHDTLEPVPLNEGYHVHLLTEENEKLRKENERLRNTIVRMRALANDTLNM